MSNSLLELLNEAVLLTKELVENETMSQTQQAEILRGIANKINSAISYSLENISTFVLRIAYEPIYLMRMSPLLSSEATRKYLNIDRSEWEKLIEERRKGEYGEKGILLYNCLKGLLGGGFSTIEELLEQTSKRKYGSRLGEIWLLRTGRFLDVKTTHYEVKGQQRILIDKPDIEYAYLWKGEARETVDPPELTRDEMLEATLRVTHTITKILSHLKKIDENQQALFTVLNNMLWYRDNLYRKDEIVRDRILYDYLLYQTYLESRRTGHPFYILQHGWDEMQSVIDEHIKWLSPKTISSHAETDLAQKAIAHLLYSEALNKKLEYPFREYIEELGKDAVEHLVQGLRLQGWGRENERRIAAKWLGVIGDKEALVPLTEALNDEDGRVILYAAEALVKMGEEERTVEPLQQAFERYRFDLDPDWKDGRKQLADALARAYTVMLEEALKVHDYEKARKAKTGLEKIGKLAT